MHTNSLIGLCSLIFASVLPLQSGQAGPAHNPPSYRTSALEDLVRFHAFPSAEKIKAQSDQALAYYFSRRGAYQLVGTDLEGFNRPSAGEPQRVHLLSMVALGSESLFKVQEVVLVRYELTVGQPEVKWIEEIPLSDTQWTAEVELNNLKVTLHESRHMITKTFPIAPGDMDDPKKTSEYLVGREDLALDADWLQGQRGGKDKHNRQFLNLPFLRITIGGEYSTYGFHIDVKNPQGLSRNFSSHGCFRMAKFHLMQFYLLFKKQNGKIIPLTVAKSINRMENIDSPWPINPGAYAEVLRSQKVTAKKAPKITHRPGASTDANEQ